MFLFLKKKDIMFQVSNFVLNVLNCLCNACTLQQNQSVICDNYAVYCNGKLCYHFFFMVVIDFVFCGNAWASCLY